MYEGSIWADATTIGEPFEVQLNQRTGQWRHREINPTTREPVEDWRMGQPKARSNE